MINNLSRIILTGEHTLGTAAIKLSQIFKKLNLYDFSEETIVSFKEKELPKIK